MCCVNGSCIKETLIQKDRCDFIGGICEKTSCNKNQILQSSYFCNPGEVCCINKYSSQREKSSWWIWLIVAIVLLIFLISLFIKIKQNLKSNKASMEKGTFYKEFTNHDQNF